jgi:hypothetical protein
MLPVVTVCADASVPLANRQNITARLNAAVVHDFIAFFSREQSFRISKMGLCTCRPARP